MIKTIKYKNRYIYEYAFGDKNINYCIGFNANEPLTDEDSAGMFGLDEYQETLKHFGAKQFEYEFNYKDGINFIVRDSYFDTIEQCKKAIDYLTNMEEEYKVNQNFVNKYYLDNM